MDENVAKGPSGLRRAGKWVVIGLAGLAMSFTAGFGAIAAFKAFKSPPAPVLQIVDAETLDDMQRGNAVLVAKNATLTDKLRDEKKERGDEKADTTSAFSMLTRLIDLDEVARHILAMRKRPPTSGSAEFHGSVHLASMQFLDSIGMSVNSAGSLAFEYLKNKAFANGGQFIKELWQHELGRPAILAVARTYREELELIRRYPELKAYDVQKAHALSDVGYQERQAAVERAFGISGISDGDAVNILYAVRFLERRRMERLNGQATVKFLIEFASELAVLVHPEPIAPPLQRLGFQDSNPS